MTFRFLRTLIMNAKENMGTNQICQWKSVTSTYKNPLKYRQARMSTVRIEIIFDLFSCTFFFCIHLYQNYWTKVMNENSRNFNIHQLSIHLFPSDFERLDFKLVFTFIRIIIIRFQANDHIPLRYRMDIDHTETQN